MKKRYDYNKLIEKSLFLAFKLDKILDISTKPRKYGQPLAGMMLEIFRLEEFKKEQKLLCEMKWIEIEAKSAFKYLPSPKNIEFWYDVMTDWFTPLDVQEAFLLREWCKKEPMKKIALQYEKLYGKYLHRKTIYNRSKQAIDKIKYYLWKKELYKKVNNK